MYVLPIIIQAFHTRLVCYYPCHVLCLPFSDIHIAKYIYSSIMNRFYDLLFFTTIINSERYHYRPLSLRDKINHTRV
jgi:hypothetical protein